MLCISSILPHKLNDVQTVLRGIGSKIGPRIMSSCIPPLHSLGLSALNRIVPKSTGSYWSEHVLCTPASGFNCSGHPQECLSTATSSPWGPGFCTPHCTHHHHNRVTRASWSITGRVLGWRTLEFHTLMRLKDNWRRRHLYSHSLEMLPAHSQKHLLSPLELWILLLVNHWQLWMHFAYKQQRVSTAKLWMVFQSEYSYLS